LSASAGGQKGVRGKTRTSSQERAATKPGLEARQAASKLLGAVMERRASLDGLLDAEGGNPAFRALGETDRALVRAILTSAMRHYGVIQAMIGHMLSAPLPEGARALSHTLTTAVAQIVYLDIPDHSAVDLAVEQANRDPRSRRFANLVNAVLRRIAREKGDLLPRVTAETINAPAWLVDLLTADYGAETAREIVASHADAAPIDLTVKSDPERWAERLGGRVLPTGSVRLDRLSGAIPTLDGFDEGAWWVQDAAASIPARLFGDIAGKSVADLCAAPGGKTAQLILQGADVTAFDQSENRLKRLRSNLHRLGLEARLVAGNFMQEAEAGAFDAVLLDAPCSSTGTVRRHPDIGWTKGPEDIAKLAALQEQMLRHALTLVGPGGLVVFSNCSLARAEGEDIVERILADQPSVVRVPVRAADWPGLEAAITERGDVRTTPDMLRAEDGMAGGLDGFFAAVLAKRAD
jgi:16S rRNA (cytosine967-C5)-methyltransferase